MVEEQELEINAAEKKLRLRGSDLLTSVIGMIVCAGITGLGFMVNNHEKNGHEQDVNLVQAMKDIATATRESNQTQRVMNCLLTIDQKDRPSQLAACERMSR